MEISERIEQLQDRFDESQLAEQFDEAVLEYVDYDQMERRGIETEYEWYVRFGSGEAERSVIQWMASMIDEEPTADFHEAARLAFPDVLQG